MAYEKLKQYLDKKGIQIKTAKKEELKAKNKGKTLTTTMRNELVDQMLKDLGYLE